MQGATGADVVLAQKVIGVTADGRFGPITAAALGTWQSKHGVPATKKLDNPTWATMVYLKLVPARSNPLSPYVNVVLRRGSTGTAVKALQKAIGKLTVDGSFGPATEARVKEYQKAKGLTGHRRGRPQGLGRPDGRGRRPAAATPAPAPTPHRRPRHRPPPRARSRSTPG